MPLTWNPEISAGTVVILLSTLIAMIGLYYSMKYSIDRLHDRLGIINDRILKLEDDADKQTETLKIIAAQGERLNSLQRQVDDLREIGRLHMFQPLLAKIGE